MKKDFSLAVSYILTSASNDELASIYEAIVQRRKALSRTARVLFAKGDNVMFTNRGVDYKGVITTVKVKKAAVKVIGRHGTATNYLVPLNMLKAIS